MISKHISYKEGTYSNTATRLGIDNTPNDDQLTNMELVAEKIFEPLRSYVGGPIKINSFLDVQSLTPRSVVAINHNIAKVKLWI